METSEQRLWCTTHDREHTPCQWQQTCVPSANSAVNTLADIISQAHAAGIRAGAWSLARWILDRWPVAHIRTTLPEALRLGAPTAHQAVDEIMGLVDKLGPPAEDRETIRRKITFIYAAGMVGGRAGRQSEINALTAALTCRRRTDTD